MRLLYLFLIALAFSGCRIFNPDEQEPSYLYIDSISLTTTADQGSSSHAISEVWVYANSDIIGVFDVPARIPLLVTGNTEIKIFAGIKNNGMGATRIRYPFYESYVTHLDLKGGQEYHIDPNFQYTSAAVVNAQRNFESNNTFIAGPVNQGAFNLIFDPAQAVNGSRYGAATLDAGETYMQFIDNLDLGVSPGAVSFLEMDYSCDNAFTIGAYIIEDSNTEKYPVLVLTPTTTTTGLFPTWNKIYLDLGAVASAYPNAQNYRFYFECSAVESGTPTILLDNIKVVK